MPLCIINDELSVDAYTQVNNERLKELQPFSLKIKDK
jgi:hypothetical protein